MTFKIKDDHIKLSQFLKVIGLIDTGGASKNFLETNTILINDKVPAGRSAKLRGGDVIFINSTYYKIEK
ncbi:RNA-binding S4 domain-containing protein [Mycoplasma nasistruthionis]|uniref:RNA-binding S4 domain-containing protein n=1 Tax=Mycoplasma nasistruthionis TaxID=353852 RepID=A0A5B7XWK3_9MOLU|nr:RNA-binding S4 domain-containing protein [Mycoplasma nasistruthionis]QCZ36885.1 RNA-binding S4 domain-containing protein [Mycoplasma nasistruthionis]